MEWNGMEWNGMEWNGMEWNGMEWNGMEWNGMEWNGMEWNGMEWNGMEWNGMEWNGMEWNGMEWNGMEWNGMRGARNSAQHSVAQTRAHTLHSRTHSTATSPRVPRRVLGAHVGHPCAVRSPSASPGGAWRHLAALCVVLTSCTGLVPSPAPRVRAARTYGLTWSNFTTATTFELLLLGLPAVSQRQYDLEVSEWSLGYWGSTTHRRRLRRRVRLWGHF